LWRDGTEQRDSVVQKSLEGIPGVQVVAGSSYPGVLPSRGPHGRIKLIDAGHEQLWEEIHIERKVVLVHSSQREYGGG
jgi:hypothetical protein